MAKPPAVIDLNKAAPVPEPRRATRTVVFEQSFTVGYPYPWIATRHKPGDIVELPADLAEVCIKEKAAREAKPADLKNLETK